MKEQLIAALEKEMKGFEANSFDFNTKDYDLAIKYLKTGEKPADYYDYEILEACVNDFDQMCRDYLT